MARGTEVCSSLLSIVIKEEKMTESSGKKKKNTLDWLLVGECCFGAMAFTKHGNETSGSSKVVTDRSPNVFSLVSSLNQATPAPILPGGDLPKPVQQMKLYLKGCTHTKSYLPYTCLFYNEDSVKWIEMPQPSLGLNGTQHTDDMKLYSQIQF